MTRRSCDFLLTTWEGGGNIAPAATAVRRLVDAGHPVRVMCDAISRADFEAAGASFIPWREGFSRADRTRASLPFEDWKGERPTAGIEAVRDFYMVGNAAGYARDVLAELKRQPADAILTSEMLLGPMMAAELTGVPLAILTANVSMLPLPGIPPMGPGLMPASTDEERTMHAAVLEDTQALFDMGLAAFNTVRAGFGLEPLAHLLDQAAIARRLVIGTSAHFDFPSDRLSGQVVYAGALLGEPEWSERTWRDPFPAGDTRPLLLVAFSSTFQNQGVQIARTLEAVRDLPVRALVTTGPELDLSGLAVPDNARLVHSAPHDVVMREASIVVTHAGHGTTLRALAHGCPLLCLPMGRDQNDNAARVAWHGFGLRLDASADAPAIRQALQTLLGDPAYRRRAQAMREKIAAEIAVSPLVAELETMAGDGAPLQISAAA